MIHKLTVETLAGNVIDCHSHVGMMMKSYLWGEYPYGETIESLYFIKRKCADGSFANFNLKGHYLAEKEVLDSLSEEEQRQVASANTLKFLFWQEWLTICRIVGLVNCLRRFASSIIPV